MNHVTMLSLSSDGRIPAEAWAAAAARDRAEAEARPAQPLLVAGVAEISPAFLKRQMARVIREAAIKRASVHVRDFERAGICEADARRYFNEALMMARIAEPAIDTVAEAA